MTHPRQGQPFVPVLAPELASELILAVGLNKTALQPAYSLPKLLSEEELSKLPEAPLMPFDPTARFEQAVPFGLQEYIELVDTMGRAVHPSKRGLAAAKKVFSSQTSRQPAYKLVVSS